MTTKFIKQNQLNNDSLFREAEGLALLNKNIKRYAIPYLRTPEVITVSQSELILQHINARPASSKQMMEFGHGLAELHKIEQCKFGFEHNNFIGLGEQVNCLTSDWGQFFIEWRLLAQVDKIRNRRVKREFQKVLNKHEKSILNLIGDYRVTPSLLHGDLWSGNVLFDESGPWLIDPAVYYGDGEADIAMTKMFGGFSANFYRAYHEVRPKSEDFLRKMALYNLYHYLNHYNLFGNSYLDGCRTSLNNALLA